MDETLRILLIEDNPADADLIEDMLSDAEGACFDIVHTDKLASGLERLEQSEIDIVLLDLSLPDSQGLETFTSVYSKAHKTPIIVLSGLSDETVALKAVSEGAQDYLVKGKVDRDLLVRAIRYALERNRMLVELDGFAHTVSHDLRGPLTAMKLSGETLQKIVAAPPNEKTAHSINELTRIIVDNVDKSSVLIKDLLDLAEAGQTPKDLEVVDVRETVDRVLEETGLGVGDWGLTLEIDDDLGAIRANRTHVYQVFQNLVGNAISHNDNPEPTVVISYLGEDDQGRHKYRVKDNGPGIPPDLIDTVFFPFTKGRAGGTGIGLSIVEKISKVYGGYARVYNDGGATFEFAMADYQG